jgi:FixJ family two-component response regulator
MKNNNKNNKNDTPTVFVVDDDLAICESLQWLVESIGLGVKIYQTTKKFLDDYKPSYHGCLVLDVRMPELSGLELQKQLIGQKSTLPLIFITGHGDIPMAVKAMKGGAVDFLTKPFNDQDLLDSINKAIELDKKRHCQRAEFEEVNARFRELSPREKEVMGIIVDGHSNRIAADKLGISVKTVELHRAKIMEKTQVGSFAELVKNALFYDQFSTAFA